MVRHIWPERRSGWSFLLIGADSARQRGSGWSSRLSGRYLRGAAFGLVISACRADSGWQRGSGWSSRLSGRYLRGATLGLVISACRADSARQRGLGWCFAERRAVGLRWKETAFNARGANAPRQPRRWQHCGARQRPMRERCQSRAQIKGRASGVVLHAVVSLRVGFCSD